MKRNDARGVKIPNFERGQAEVVDEKKNVSQH